MLHQLVVPDVMSYSVAPYTCEKGKQWEEALGLLQEMDRKRMAPDMVSYRSAVGACEQALQ